MGYDITMSFREPYLIWQNTYQLRASWRKMLLCPLEIDQGKQGKDPGKYEFSPSLADVFWTFQGLSSSLWSLITMTEDVSALMSQSIWLPLLSYSYSLTISDFFFTEANGHLSYFIPCFMWH